MNATPPRNPMWHRIAALILAMPCAALAQADSAFSVPVEVTSQGVTMRATFFVAAGPGPHATMVVLKGFPGGNQNDFARFMQSRGFNAVAMNFRGQGESEGTYDVAGTARDAAAFVAFLKSDSVRRTLRIDPRRIVLSGQSAGSFATLSAAAVDESIQCVSLTVPFNWALPLLDARGNPVVQSAMAAQVNAIAARSPRAVRVDSMFVRRSLDAVDSIDLRRAAARLKGRRILMIGAGRDATAPMPLHFDPVRDSLRLAPNAVRDTTFDDAHNLNASVPVVYDLLADWALRCTTATRR